jgi:uncharacterized iron-regulated protein
MHTTVQPGFAGHTAMRNLSFFAVLSLLVCLDVRASPLPPQPSGAACGQPGQWLLPGAPTAAPLAARALLDRLAGQQVVLLGETHDRADDHRWQLDVLTALHGRRPEMAIGFEMFPRRAQSVLDRWVAGELSEAAFLKAVDWDAVWRHDAELYLPLFRFARQHRLPMLALNVDQSLVRQVAAHGWDAVPEAQRQGLSRPAPPADAYRKILQGVFDSHVGSQNAAGRFEHFVEAQILWDRAMAEGIAGHLRHHPRRLVVGILGAGHIKHGHGVPHQLKAMAVTRLSSVLTWPSDLSCAALTAGLADAVFVIPPQPQAVAHPPPRLGVRLDMAGDEVLIETVLAGSLAEQTGLKAGDVVLQAGGRKPKTIEALVRLVQRQPAGAALPLQIRRGKDVFEIIVRFPAQP